MEEVLEGSENNGRIALGYGSSILVARLFAGFELARRRVPVGRSRGAIAVAVSRRRGRRDTRRARGRKDGRCRPFAREGLDRRPRASAVDESSDQDGWTYVPPFKLAQMMRETTDKTSAEYQRMSLSLIHI